MSARLAGLGILGVAGLCLLGQETSGLGPSILGGRPKDWKIQGNVRIQGSAIALSGADALIEQSVRTIPGRSYRLAFDCRSSPPESEIQVQLPEQFDDFRLQTCESHSEAIFVAKIPHSEIKIYSQNRAGVSYEIGNISLVQLVPPASDLSGRWIDSQGNEFLISQNGNEIRIGFSGWTHRTASTTAHLGNVTIDGYISGSAISARFDRLSLTGQAASGRIRMTVQGPQFVTPVDEILSRLGAQPRVATNAPARIFLECSHLSAAVGTWIPCRVALADNKNSISAPRDDTLVYLSATGGHSIPEAVRVTARHPVADAGLVVDVPGEIPFQAKSGKLPVKTVNEYGCARGDIDGVSIEHRYGTRASTGEEGIGFNVLLLGVRNVAGKAQRELTENGSQNYVKLDTTLGHPTASPGQHGIDRNNYIPPYIPPGECVVEYTLRSDSPGTADVKASVVGATAPPDEAFFYFVAPLGAMLLWASLGSVGGAFASGTRNDSGKWRAMDWLVWLLCGVLGGATALLAYYYGILNQLPQFPSGNGFPFLLGLAGGYLGREALGRVANLLFPRGPGS